MKRILPTNQKGIDALQLDPTKSDEILWSDALPGFGLRLRRDVKKRKWIYQYDDVAGKTRRIDLGDTVTVKLAQAFDAARKAAADRINDIDPRQIRDEKTKAATKAANSLFGGSFLDEYLNARRLDPKIADKKLANITRHLRSSWACLHDVPVAQVTTAQIRARLAELRIPNGFHSGGRYAADDAQSAIKTYFGWLIKEGKLVAGNPVIDGRLKEKRARFLSSSEIVTLWNDSGDGDYGCIVKLLLLTGCRLSEISELQWSEISDLELDQAQIELSGNRTKNGLPHIVPLCLQARRILRDLWTRRTEGKLAVFGNTDRGFQNFSRDKKRIGIAADTWRLHDIRRTFVTHCNEQGFGGAEVIEAAVNHVSGTKAGVAGVYNRAKYLPQRRALYDQWGAWVEKRVNPQPEGNVVPFAA